MLYFKIDPSNNAILDALDGDFSAYNTKADSAVNGKPFLTEVVVTDPPCDYGTQVKEGPVDAYDGTNATRVYTVRDKTAGERAAETIWSTLQFMERFTKQERGAIRAAAKQSDDVEDWLDLLRAAQEVKPTDPRTVSGMAALVAAGLLTAQRSAEILAP